MDPRDGTDVARQIPSTRRDGQVLGRIETIGVDHKSPVIVVDRWRLTTITTVEEFGQLLSFVIV